MENLSRFCRVLVLTRTVWDEPPRLRHQLTQLLLAAGYRVAFAQKPGSIFAPSARVLAPPSGTPCLSLLSPRELLHHQLRLVPWLHHFNAYFARRDLRKTISCAGIPRLTQKDLIINFNYDAFWLRSLFPDRPIITIINDDFEALSRFPFHHHLTWALKRTCAMSNRVLTVSEPLRQRLAHWCYPELFLPWAADPYRPPQPSPERKVLLFWGFINERMDASALQACLPELECTGLRLRFVGPLLGDPGRELQRCLGHSPAVEWLPACSFAELDTSDCLAALIPYRLDCPGVEAIQLSNKALQLLSRGLPLITSPMPNFHTASFVCQYGTSEYTTLMAAALAVRDQFLALQPAIASFVAANGPEARLRQLLGSAA